MAPSGYLYILIFGPDVYMERVAIYLEGTSCPTLPFSFFFRKVFRLLSLRPTGISILDVHGNGGIIGISRF